MDILQNLPRSKSGYYWVKIGDKDAQVYCDMENYGMQNRFSSRQAFQLTLSKCSTTSFFFSVTLCPPDFLI